MKGFKIIHTINKGVFFLTLVLFITIYIGFLMELLLGATQLLSSLILIFYWKQFSIKVKQKLALYWISTLIYGSMWFLDWKFLDDWMIYIVGIGVIPLGIATYFLTILSAVKKESKIGLTENVEII